MNNNFRRTVLAIAALALPLSEHAMAADALKVMSFNIRYGTANDGDNHWDNRHELVIKTVQDFDPDVLGTQETVGFQAEYLKQHLPAYTYVGSSRDANPNGEQCGLLFRTARFELVKSGQFWLSETPDTKFSKSWDSSLPRIATWAQLQDRLNDNQELLFINTHFDHRGSVARLESAKLLRRFVESQPKDLPVIITGDFNCAEASDPYNALAGSDRLSDSYRLVHQQREPNEGTFNGFVGTATGARIDWILCSPQFTTTSASINRFHDNGRYPSDHFPVSAVLEVK